MTVHDAEISCREFVELVTDYQEDALPEPVVDLVEEHLVLCDWCRDYLGQLEVTVAATAKIVDEPPPAAELATAMAAFRAARRRRG
jgi:predicted anti-sigma-YlaC factor YlaD